MNIFVVLRHMRKDFYSIPYTSDAAAFDKLSEQLRSLMSKRSLIVVTSPKPDARMSAEWFAGNFDRPLSVVQDDQRLADCVPYQLSQAFDEFKNVETDALVWVTHDGFFRNFMSDFMRGIAGHWCGSCCMQIPYGHGIWVDLEQKVHLHLPS